MKVYNTQPFTKQPINTGNTGSDFWYMRGVVSDINIILLVVSYRS